MNAPGPQLGGRFRVRSPAELGDRARQRIRSWFELFGGASRGQEPSDASLERVLTAEPSLLRASPTLDARRAASGIAAFSDAARAGELARTRFPESASRIIARADRACADRFDIFGHIGLSYGDPIDWHRDPMRGRRAPRLHWSRVPYLDVERVGDHKVIWELNRHQHLVTLGQAYRLTADERYAGTIVRHLTEWMDANPPKLGINWSSSLELSFRAIAWTWALQLVRGSRALTPEFVRRVMKFLYIHVKHVGAHLSTYFSPNTHLTGEALGLLYVGTCFGEFADSEDWRELGWSILERELARQVRADGTYFEQTTWYQRYTADFYLHAVQLREQGGQLVGDEVRRSIGRIIDPLVHLTDPRGLTPLIGDDDGGQLLPLVPGAPSDFRPTLAHAAALLERSDCAAVADTGAASCLPWLVGESGLATFDALPRVAPAETTRLFPDGGYAVARDRWTPDADFLVFDCGPHGALSCGHAHADALSVVVTLGGHPVLVDPGTCSYAEPERAEFRTTAAHNTLLVDGASSSEPDRPFRWRSAAECVLFRTASSARFAFFEGAHDGFARLPDPARHRRAVFAPFGEFVAIFDTVEARGAHVIEGRFHFDSGLVVTAGEQGDKLTAAPSARRADPLADLFVLGDDIALEVVAGRVAPTYGIAVDAAVGRFTSSGVGTRRFWTVLAPRGGLREPRVLNVPVHAGSAIIIRSAEIEDLLVASDNGPRLEGLSTDATWLWLRRTAARSEAVEFVLLGGSRLSVGGEAIVSLPARREHVWGRRVESRWELRVSAG